ncbi:MAG: hypothetical protein JXR97_06875 [Planctomycetes bacterium]|nr:hypothetical protein [Planctomycetota bacterium]
MSPRKRKHVEPKTLEARRLQEYFGEEIFSEIGRKTDISRVQVSSMLQGESSISEKMLKYVAENGGDVNYILTGNKSVGKTVISATPNTVTHCHNLPLIGCAAADNQEASRAIIEPQAVEEIQLIKEHYQAIKILGNSMEPVVLDGQYVMIGSEIMPGSEIRKNGWIGVVQIDLKNTDFPEPVSKDTGVDGIATFCKRINKVGDDMLLLSSINSSVCQPFTVMRCNIIHLWPVHGVFFAGQGVAPED